MRYEALVADPAGECTKLCTFLGLPYADTMLEFHEGRTRRNPVWTRSGRGCPSPVGLRDWRSRCVPKTSNASKRRPATCSTSSATNGAFLNPGPQVLEHATELRDSLARGDAVPNGLSAAQALVERAPRSITSGTVGSHARRYGHEGSRLEAARRAQFHQAGFQLADRVARATCVEGRLGRGGVDRPCVAIRRRFGVSILVDRPHLEGV